MFKNVFITLMLLIVVTLMFAEEFKINESNCYLNNNYTIFDNDRDINIVNRWAYGINETNCLFGDHLYVGNGGVLQILDASQLSSPQLLSEFITDSIIQKIKIYDNIAFLITNYNTIQIIDVSNSTNPILLGVYEFEGPYPYFTDFVVYNNYLLITDVSNGILLVNIQNLYNPTLSSIYNTEGSPYSIRINDEYAYVSNDDNFIIMDISTPSNPVELGNWSEENVFIGDRFDFFDSKIYFLNWNDLYIIDVSNPNNPTEIINFHVNGAANSISVINDYLYVSIPEIGFRIIDISDFQNPIELSTYNTSIANIVSGANNHFIINDIAVVADWYNGAHIIDISNPSQPTELSHHLTQSWAYDIKFEDNIAYLVDGAYGLVVMDITDPQYPVEINHINLPSWNYSNSIEITENYLFICNSWEGIRILDKTSLDEIGFYTLDDKIYNVKISENENLMYVPAMSNGLKIINIENPNNPYQIGEYPAPEGSDFFDLSLYENFIYISNYHGEYFILDILDPTNPSFLSSIQTSDNGGNHLAINFPYLYAADGYEGLQVINISNPMNPFIENTLIGSFGWNVDLTDNYLLYTYPLCIFDLSNPSSPELLDTAGFPGSAKAATEIDNYIYLANGYGGLYVLNYQPSNINPSNLIKPSLLNLCNYPNPFNPATTISFSIPETSIVDVTVFNVKGQKIKTIINDQYSTGVHSFVWNGVDDYGNSVGSGVYLYKLMVNGKLESSRRCLLLK